MTVTATAPGLFPIETSPEEYRHWSLAFDGDVATLEMKVDPDHAHRDGYELKQNSYDLAVDIELADAIQRLRFEHPEVRACVVTGTMDRVFCAGANIMMLRSSQHGFKVNFCKFTNETRLGIEDASANSSVRFLAALNGTAAGGGYELALACDEILLVDDRSSAVSFPEVPLLGVLPGTGGLTRITDKRKLRRDRTDLFSTVAEGIKGKRALEWNLVDHIAPPSKFDETRERIARELADRAPARGDRGVALDALDPAWDEDARTLTYRHAELKLDADARIAELTLRVPSGDVPTSADAAFDAGADWWILRMIRELDHALVSLRLFHPDVALVLIRATGDAEAIETTDALLAGSDHWFVNEVRHQIKRTLKRLEVTSKSFYAVADEGTAFVGTFLELLLACDRSYVLNDEETPVELGLTRVHAGLYPMANGLTRLETRFLGTPDAAAAVLEHAGQRFDAETADELGLASLAPDEIDWEDELRIAIEERASFSPDAMTGMESNLRFAGPETMETKIFGRLSAWQNWIFIRPNAVGERGALQCYGTPHSPEFDTQRT